MRFFTFLFLFIACQKSLLSWQGLTLHNLNSPVQGIKTNPAFIPESKIHIGIPFISHLSAYYGNNSFTYHDFYKVRSDDSVQIDIDNAISKMGKRNYISAGISTDILSIGYKLGPNFFHAGITEQLQFGFSFDKALIELLDKGNGPFIGTELDFGKTGFDASHYREYALGMSRQINEKFSAGFRIKHLYGMENFSSTTGSFGLYTSPEDYSLIIPTEVIIHTSSLENSEPGYDGIDSEDKSEKRKNIRNYLYKMDNRGWGIDIGAQYVYNEKWKYGIALNNLGYIRWKSNVKNFRSEEGSYSFGGVDLKGFINDSTTNIQNVLDSLSGSFGTSENSDHYSSVLPANLRLNASYNLNENSSISGLLHFEYFKESLHPSLTFAYNLKATRNISLSTSWSYLNNSAFNFGAGVSANAGPVQFYLVSDNVYGTFLPLNTKSANVQAGFNLIFGRPKRDRDRDKVADKNDKCPDIPGLPALEGCPDKDMDGVPDHADACPDTAGLKKFEGCPDSDNDGVPDAKDACPDLPGLEIFRGCPDTDGDSIPDLEDDCIYDKGPWMYNGCPDTDEDGIIDRLDSCILVPGPASNNGCPIIEKNEIINRPPQKAVLEAEEQEVLNRVFSNLEFETGKAVIRPESYSSLEELVSLLRRKPNYKILIEGHTDNTGSASANKVLSQKRADVVKEYLQKRMIDEYRIRSFGHGSEKPIATNSTAEGRKLNRRVEFTVLE
ncbi:MAG: hypothetical protein DWQ48_13725 [Bacteroidetes bacterium]|nr:MAG: hypothetical protein DWQ48_13725 [Bacteroidota bacterium]